MYTYVFKRLGQSALALLFLLLLVFAMTRLTGDPTNFYLPEAASEQARIEFAQANGFDQPLYIQMFTYFANILRGDFGLSIFNQRPAMEVALEAFPITLTLAGITMAIAIPLAVALGTLAAIKPNGVIDRVVSILTVVSASAPSFWVAIIAIFVFSMELRWLPTSGMGTPRHWIMPIAILVIVPLGLMTQVARTSMVSSLSAPYAKTAMAKGASDLRVIVVHALRNSLLPLTTISGTLATGLVNGAVVVETVFGFPGIGKFMIESIRLRDFTLTIACILLAAVTIFMMNLLIDLLYAWLDPRVQVE